MNPTSLWCLFIVGLSILTMFIIIRVIGSKCMSGTHVPKEHFLSIDIPSQYDQVKIYFPNHTLSQRYRQQFIKTLYNTNPNFVQRQMLFVGSASQADIVIDDISSNTTLDEKHTMHAILPFNFVFTSFILQRTTVDKKSFKPVSDLTILQNDIGSKDVTLYVSNTYLIPIVKTILHLYSIDPKKYTFTVSKRILDPGIYFVLYPTDQVHMLLRDIGSRISTFLSLSSVDKDKFKYFFPFLRLTDKDLIGSMVSNRLSNIIPVRTFESYFVLSSNHKSKYSWAPIIIDMLSVKNNEDEEFIINLYNAIKDGPYPTSIYQEEQNITNNYSYNPITQEDAENSIVYDVEHNIVLEVLEQVRTIYKQIRFAKTIIPVKLAYFDVISLKYQRNIDNGLYYIVHIDESFYYAESAIKLEIDDEAEYEEHKFFENIKTYKNKKPIRAPLSKNMSVYFYNQDIPAVVEKQYGNGIFLFKMFNDRENDDNEMECIPAFDIKRKANCEASQDNVWDKRCETDDECPFYQKNKNYPNQRGRCKEGYCEMPVGIERRGFRLYNKKTKPYCYNCPEADNPMCCDEQIQKDYAYANDLLERLQYADHLSKKGLRVVSS